MESVVKNCGNCKNFVYNPDGNGIIYRCQINGSIGNDCKPIDCKNWNMR